MIHRLALSLGLCLAFAGISTAATLIPTNSTWRLFKGRTEASSPDTTAWRAMAFNDSTWSSSPAPFSYGEPGIVTGTFLNDMRSNYTCIFLRHTFVVTNVAEIDALRLGAACDDGFIAWVNGTEVARYNMPGGNVPFNGVASSAPAEPVPFDSYTALNPGSYLAEGNNVLAVQVFNNSLNDSSDLLFQASLSSEVSETVPPTITGINPTPGTVNQLTSITVQFSEPVTGVDASDFLVNGLAVSVASGSGSTYTFTFAQPPYGTVTIGWSTNHGIFDEAIVPNAFDSSAPGASWQYQLVDQTPPMVTTLFPAASTAVRALTQIEVTFSEDVAGVDAADLRINGQPASSVSKVPGGPHVFQFSEPAPGTVIVSWHAGHGITDIAPSPNAFAGGSWTYSLDPNTTTADLVITEILAANVSGLADEDGDNEDWIEIQNQGTSPVDLAGWSLSDDPDVPGLWVFGSRLLNPGQYIIVFASGKDRRNPAGNNRFHTNFRLGNGGEHLGLYSPDSPRIFVRGFVTYPEQRNNHSYGYDTGGNLRYFATPTPGAPNGTSSIIGVVEPVHFNVERGHFTSPFDLYLSTETPGATIRLTVDGSEPTESNGLPYTNSVRVVSNAFVRAAAFKANMLPSRSQTHSYFFNQPATVRSLPIISLTTATNNLIGRTGIIGMEGGSRAGDGLYITNNPATDYHNPSAHGIAWERPVSAELIRLDGEPGFQIDCGIRVQGSDYQRPRTVPTSKFSFRLYFRSDYGPGRLEYPFFTNTTVADFDQLVLRAGFNDNANPFIRDELTRRLSADMGAVASHGNLVNVFINGQYRGYYNPTERVHEEMLQNYHGGGVDWDVISPSFAQSAEGPGVVDGDRANFNALDNYINTQQVTNQAIYQQVTQRLDVVNFVDYCLLNVYCGMGDWPANNWRAGRDRTPGTPGNIWRFYIWDGEWSMGIYGRAVTRDTFAENGPGPDNSGLSSIGNSEIARMYQRLRLNPEFRLLWADRIHKHFFNNGALTDTNIVAHFNSLRNEMSVVLPGMANDILTTWVPQRRGINMTQFQNYGLLASSNAPIFNRHGGRVARNFVLTMTASNLTDSVIYYTTNGVDPRVMFTAAVSPDAQAYASGITLQNSTVVKARTLRNGTNWSALTEAQFDIGIFGLPIRITEINYNPPGGNGFEFIELLNVGATPVDLGGVYFEGITFTFPAGSILTPGARLVLSSDLDPNGFAARYPTTTVAGRFSGSLANGGERITLLDRFGTIIVSVDYDDENGWPSEADGQGSSIEINDPFGNPDDPNNWRASAQLHGTPGSTSATPALPTVRINELMATNFSAVANAGTFPDWIELHNSGGSPANIGGWSLTDDGNPRKFVFSAGTTIPAGGYLVVWCDSITNTTPGIHTGFALDRNSETVLLYNSATSRVDGVTYGLQVVDRSIGRIGAEWQLNLPTPNALNMAAPLGNAYNLAINEWLANPFPGQSDWVEIHNVGTSPVALGGLHIGVGAAVHQIIAASYVPARGFAQIFLDENVGPDHLDVRLPASGGAIVLYDAAASELTRVSYAAQAEGVSQGRLPNGTGPVTTFAGTSSPGASNYVVVYNGPVINEVMARNRSAITNSMGDTSDWIELFNPASTNVDLGGMSLSVGNPEPGEWVFPAGTVMTPGTYLIVWCEDLRPPTTASSPYLNTGRNLDGESGGVYLFNAAGQLVNSIEYGFQIENRSIGRSGAQWRLMSAATLAAANAAAATLGSATNIVFNEWMAQRATGPDWLELYNSGPLPVDLSGLYLTDDPSVLGTNKFRVEPLSFIDGSGWVQFIADEDPSAGGNHLTFSLAGGGESLRLYSGTNILAAQYFGYQTDGASEGRLPDGSANIVQFPSSASPAASNYLPPHNVVINEVLTHSTAPLEDAIELHNPSDEPAAIGGWYLSDSTAFKKYRIPAGTTIPAGGYRVFYQVQFADDTLNAFQLDRARGGELWLSEADSGGNLTGVRANVRFGAALNGVSIGTYPTHLGTKFVALTQRSFGSDNPASVGEFRSGGGLPNAAARVGPIVINEIMYHPPDIVTPTNILNNTDDEYVELHNVSGSTVSLANWRLTGGIGYSFSGAVSLPAGGYLIVVSFDPSANATVLNAFRATYGLAPSVPIFGPYSGRLDNVAETVSLRQPDTADGIFVPYVVIDEIDYTDSAPWPAGATDGGGLAMQRVAAADFGNEPANWVAGDPTPGSANSGPIVNLPVITQSPVTQTNAIGAPASLSVSASGAGPLSYQWRFNGRNIAGATNTTFQFTPFEIQNAGVYDVLVSNEGGSSWSEPATISASGPPTIAVGPQEFVVRPGTNVLFSVTAGGPGPLSYQWTYNGADIPGATGRFLSVTNVILEQSGDYSVRVNNPYSTINATGRLIVLVEPVFLANPQSATVLVGDTVTLRASVYGTTPMRFRWRRNSSPFVSFEQGMTTLTLTNVQLSENNVNYDIVATNRANAAPGRVSAKAFLTVLADTDGDRAPDSWETANGFSATDPLDATLDTDGDGASNVAEFVAGTNPNDPLSYLRVSNISLAGTASIQFVALSNKNYTVQFSDDGPSGMWSTLAHVLLATNPPPVRTVTVVDSNAVPQRYYRLVTPYQP